MSVHVVASTLESREWWVVAVCVYTLIPLSTTRLNGLDKPIVPHVSGWALCNHMMDTLTWL